MANALQRWTLTILILLCLFLVLVIHRGLSEQGHNLGNDATQPLRWSNNGR